MANQPVFYVVGLLNLIVLLLSLFIQATALVHCLIQKGDGFQAIGTLPKGAWAAILLVSTALTLLFAGALDLSPDQFFAALRQSFVGIFTLIGIAAGLIYLLDVRPGLKDLSDGKGFW